MDTALTLEDQTSCRAVSENAAVPIRQPAFSRTDAAPTSNDQAFSPHQAGLRGDRPNKRDLELERHLPKPLVQHRLDCEPHAAVKQGCRETSVNSPGGVEVACMG